MAVAQAVSLTGESLTLDDVWAVAVERGAADLSDEGRERLRIARAVVDELAASGGRHPHVRRQHRLRPLRRARDPDRSSRRSSSFGSCAATRAGWGSPIRTRSSARAMLLRANALATGCSGARPETVELLLAVLNAGIAPGRARAGLGRRIGRPRAARASGASAHRRGRGDPRTARRFRARRRSRGRGSADPPARRRRASRSSTAPSS